MRNIWVISCVIGTGLISVAGAIAEEKRVAQELGEVDGVMAKQLQTRNCEFFTNDVLLEHAEGDPFVSPVRPDIAEYMHQFGRMHLAQCIGERDRVNRIDIFSRYPEMRDGEPRGDPRLQAIGTLIYKSERLGGITFEASGDAVSYAFHRDVLAREEKLQCESGRSQYTESPDEATVVSSPVYWSGELVGFNRQYSDGQLSREDPLEREARVRVTQQGEAVLQFGQCFTSMIPQSQSFTGFYNQEQRFDVRPFGASGCGKLREAIYEGGKVWASLDEDTEDTLHLSFHVETAVDRFGYSSDVALKGPLAPTYLACVPAPKRPRTIVAEGTDNDSDAPGDGDAETSPEPTYERVEYHKPEDLSSPAAAEWTVYEWQKAVRSRDCERLYELACSGGSGVMALTGVCSGSQADQNAGIMQGLFNYASDYSRVRYEFERTDADRGVVHYRGAIGYLEGWSSSEYEYEPIEQVLGPNARRSVVVLEDDRWKVCR